MADNARRNVTGSARHIVADDARRIVADISWHNVTDSAQYTVAGKSLHRVTENINPVTRDAAFFESDLPPPLRHAHFSSSFGASRRFLLLFAYFQCILGASRSNFAVRDCISFPRFTPPSP